MPQAAAFGGLSLMLRAATAPGQALLVCCSHDQQTPPFPTLQLGSICQHACKPGLHTGLLLRHACRLAHAVRQASLLGDAAPVALSALFAMQRDMQPQGLAKAPPCSRKVMNTLMLLCRWFCGQWLENSAQADVAAPVEHCFRLWEDRELIPNWMPWITSVKVCLSGMRGLA